MFQFRRFPSYTYWFSIWYPKVGFPIRKSTDQGSFAAPRSLSQLITSFIGSWCQGIPLALLLAWSFSDLTNQEKSNILVLSHYSKNYAGSISEVFKTKLYLLPLNFKSFPLLLPSHNCIHNNNVQFSRCSFESTRDSVKHLFQGASINLF